MTNKSFPRMGKSHLLKSVREIIEAIRFAGPMTEKEIKAEMSRINVEHDAKVYTSPDEALHFLSGETRSIRVIAQNDDGEYELTDSGERLVNARNFEQELFNLMEERSRTEFTDYHEILERLSRRVENNSLELGTSQNSAFESMLTDPNSYSAKVSSNFMEEFGIIHREGRMWIIDPQRFAELQRDDEEMAMGILEQFEGRMARNEFEEYLSEELGWSDGRIETAIESLENDRRIEHQRAEGTDWITSKG